MVRQLIQPTLHVASSQCEEPLAPEYQAVLAHVVDPQLRCFLFPLPLLCCSCPPANARVSMQERATRSAALIQTFSSNVYVCCNSSVAFMSDAQREGPMRCATPACAKGIPFVSPP